MHRLLPRTCFLCHFDYYGSFKPESLRFDVPSWRRALSTVLRENAHLKRPQLWGFHERLPKKWGRVTGPWEHTDDLKECLIKVKLYFKVFGPDNARSACPFSNQCHRTFCPGACLSHPSSLPASPYPVGSMGWKVTGWGRLAQTLAAGCSSLCPS